MNDLFTHLPQVIQSKILLYYLSYGTPASKIIQTEIDKNYKGATLWHTHINTYLLHHYMSCPYEVTCDLRLALIEYNNSNKHLVSVIHHFYKKCKNIKLLQFLSEEK